MINDSSNIKSFKEILEEYDFAARCIKMKSSYYYKLLSKGYNIPSAGALYEYCSIQEAHKVEEKLRIELDRKYTLELTASCEAKSVYYFKNILNRRNPLYLSYINNVPSTVRHGISHLMYNHLIVVFREVIRPNNSIVYSEFKNLIDFRNWLAHGRGWELQQHLEKFDFSYSYTTVQALTRMLPNFPDN
jgi:hypothetical protein